MKMPALRYTERIACLLVVLVVMALPTVTQAGTDIKVGANFYDTIPAAYSALASGDTVQLDGAIFTAPMVFNRPVSFTLRGGYDPGFTTVTGMSSLYGTMVITDGSVIVENIALIGSPSPAFGNNGTVTASNPTPAGVSLTVSTGSGSLCANDLLYQAYYSDTNSLTSVAAMEAYGTPFGVSSPAVLGWVAGKVNGGLNFSGSDYVDAGHGSGLNFGTGSFSVETWINPSSWGNLSGIIGKGANTPLEPGYTLRQITSGTDKYLQFVLGNGARQVAVANSGFVENVWYHLVGVADRTNNVLKLYVNGALAASASMAGFSGSTDSALNLTLGKQHQQLDNQDHFFSGIIDEAAVYNRALSGAEIAGRYNAGAGKSIEVLNGLTAGWRFDEAGGTTTADVSGGGNTGGLHFSATIDVSGLASLLNYSMNVMVTDACGNKWAYSPTTVSTPILPIAFSGGLIPYDMFMPAVGDLNNDGFIEALGTFNDSTGNLVAASAASMGLDKLFAPGRVQRDCRMADFNGDGLPDLICNTYSPSEAYTNPDPLCQGAAGDYSPDSMAMLFFNNGNGTFREDTTFTARQIMGFGETILVADFNNDGYLDIFLPYYSYCSPNEHSYLLLNDGTGNFTEVSDAAGVSLRNVDIDLRGEGTQAVDFNNDGWIDFYVGSHLFINNGVQNGVPTFTDQRAALGLPEVFDEGIKFLDWNNDGYLDLVIHHPTTGPAIYQYDGTGFSLANILPTYPFSGSNGLNVFDMNNDGREDIIVSGGGNDIPDPTVVYLNNGTGFERSNPTPMDALGEDTISFGDINGDGRLDVLKREVDNGGFGLAYFRNMTAVPENSFFKIDVRGSAGQRNQQGRIVKIYPQKHAGVIFTRIVDSGSGYQSQSPYDIFVGTPYQEPHRVEVYYQGAVVSFMINPGEKKRVFPNGLTENY